MTRYQLEIFEYSHYAQKSFTYVAEALTPLLRLGTFSWIVTCDSHQKILNSQPRSRPTRQRSAAHQWAAAHRLRTAAGDCLPACLTLCLSILIWISACKSAGSCNLAFVGAVEISRLRLLSTLTTYCQWDEPEGVGED